jgi:hypothetical protein
MLQIEILNDINRNITTMHTDNRKMKCAKYGRVFVSEAYIIKQMHKDIQISSYTFLALCNMFNGNLCANSILGGGPSN